MGWVILKIGIFIKILSDTFASQIAPSESTGRTSNQLKYQTVITWFISYGAEEQELVNKAMMKGKDNYCNKIMNESLEDDMPIQDAMYLKGRINPEGFEEIFDEAQLDDAAIKSFIRKMAVNGIKITNNLTKSMHSYSNAFSSIKFIDGSPFGIKE